MKRIAMRAVALVMTVAAAGTSATTAATASTPEVTANCDGIGNVISANYVRLNNPSKAIVGSIQLCRGAHVWARIEMYAPLPRGHFANAFLYRCDGSACSQSNCDDNRGHVLPGGRICSSPFVYPTIGHTFHAVGREYRSNGSGGWILNAAGVTGKYTP